MTKFTNLFGTITAILAVVMGVMTSVLGCTAADTTQIALNATCTASWLKPEWAGWAALAFGILAIISKLLRPGGALHSLFGSTAVVVPDEKATAGVVTKAQVESFK
jgi:hypothetical protein